jgi:hypothetical protein
MAKLFASEMAEKVCSAALQTLDVYVQDVYEGTGGIGEQRRVNAIIALPTAVPAAPVPAGQPGPGGKNGTLGYGVEYIGAMEQVFMEVACTADDFRAGALVALHHLPGVVFVLGRPDGFTEQWLAARAASHGDGAADARDVYVPDSKAPIPSLLHLKPLSPWFIRFRRSARSFPMRISWSKRPGSTAMTSLLISHANPCPFRLGVISAFRPLRGAMKGSCSVLPIPLSAGGAALTPVAERYAWVKYRWNSSPMNWAFPSRLRTSP